MTLFRALLTYTLLAGILDYLASLGRKLRYRYAVVFKLGEDGVRTLDQGNLAEHVEETT